MDNPGTDPAGDEAERLARGARGMKAAAESPFYSIGNGAASPDPFAPLGGSNGTSHTPPPREPEIWEPVMPIPGGVPEHGHVRHYKHGPSSCCWTYRDAEGRPLFLVARFDLTDGRKEVLPYCWGRRVWTLASGPNKGTRRDQTGFHFKAPIAPRSLYGLDRLAAAGPDAVVLLAEGEKSADAATVLFPDMAAMASQGGADGTAKADWSALAGRSVVIWPDRDKAGEKYAHAVAAALKPIGATIRVVRVPPEWPDGWDLADELPPGVTPELLRELLNAADAPEEPAEPDAEPADADNAMPEEEIAAELERLSWLPNIDYQRARKPAAQRLGMGVIALDKAIAALKAKRRGEAQAEHRAKPDPAAGETLWPLGFLTLDDGLYFDAGGDAGPTWLCAPLDVLGQGRDAAGEAWGLFLRWRDADHRLHTWPMPAKMLMVQPGELEAELVDRGLRLNAEPGARACLRQGLAGVRSGSRVAFADAPGWCSPGLGGSAFMLIDGEVIGTAPEQIVLKAAPENAVLKMASAGTLDGWKNAVARPALGNPVAAFAICAAFAGPLLTPLGEASGGFHFFGRSKAGKTLAARMGISVWGPTRKSGLLRDWRSTANALEGAAEECNDGFLVLDEIHQAEPKDVVGAVYQLANESGKQRLTREATSKRRRTWRTMVVSTGEIDIATMAAKHSPSPLPAGAEVRVPSIPIDGRDMWPKLHGEGSPAALMTKLQHALLQQHGTPIRAFLRELTAYLAANDGSLDLAAAEQRDHFFSLLPESADAQVREVARRCALVALAGELATEWGVLPWEAGEATTAAETILAWWLTRRGGAGSTEESQHVKAVRAYLSEFGASRFVALNYEKNCDAQGNDMPGGHWVERHPDRPVVSRTGWRRRANDGGDQYLIDADGWRKICEASGADPHEVAKTLLAAGHIDPGEGKNILKKTRLPGVGQLRVYVIRPSIFAQADDAVACAAA